MVLDVLAFLWTAPLASLFLASTLQRLPGPLARTGTTLLVLHESTGARSPALSVLAHSASVRLQVTRERWLPHHNDIRGYQARVEILKNRLGPAGRAVNVAIEFNGTVRGEGL